MKRLFAFVWALMALVAAAAELPKEIKLTNGFVMKECVIIRWATDAITVKYVGGTVPVRFENIDPAERQAIESHKEEALKRQLAADQKDAKALARVEHRQEVHENREARAREKLDQKAAAIEQGLQQHQLVVGMTMEQVKAMFGPPLESSSLSNVNESNWWIYAGKGKDANGVPANLQVHFRAGVVTRWNNTQR